MPVVSLTKTAYTDSARNTEVSTANRLFAGEPVYYRAVFTNINDAGKGTYGSINFSSIVDLLPQEQSYTPNSIAIKIKKKNLQDETYAGTVTAGTSTGNKRRVEFDLPTDIRLEQGDSVTIEYSAKVSDDENAIRALMSDANSAAVNTIALYPYEESFALYSKDDPEATPLDYSQLNDGDIFKLTQTLPHGVDITKYVTAAADVYYDVSRIHPDIQKTAYFDDKKLTTSIYVGENESRNIEWELMIANGNTGKAADATMKE
jgi:hypothetical protein